MKNKFIPILTSILIIFSSFTSAYQADRDPTFDTGVLKGNFDSSVQTIAIQSDGKILLGGNFTSYALNYGNPVNKIIRLNADGSRDYSFDIGAGFDKEIYSIQIQNDGKILVGGGFTSYNGESANGIIRLNTDGSKDSSFDIGSGITLGSRGYVYDIQIQSDGKILLGGNFVGYDGQTVNSFVRINTDGSIDNSFDMDTWFDDQVSINSIAIQSDDKILIGGSFVSFSGEATNAIIRLNSNGSRDSSFDMGTGFGEREEVYEISLQNDGKILAGGEFNIYKGLAAKNIIRLNSNGSRDSSFDMGTGFNDRGTVHDIQIQDNGKLIIGGSFSSYNGESANGIIGLNSDGSRNSSLDIGSGFNERSSISSLAIQNDGKVIAGGNFDSYNGEWNRNIIRLNSNGSKDYSFDSTAFDSPVMSITIQDDNKIIIGGAFTKYDTIAANGIIRLNIDGTKDDSFVIGSGFNDVVQFIEIQNDGKILVGGGFTEYNGISANRIIRLNADGSRDYSFDMGSGFNNIIQTIVIQNDGKILVGGSFTEYNGISANRIIRLNTNGSRDSSFDMGTGFGDNIKDYSAFGWGISTIPGVVNSIDILSGGKIIAAGGFNSYNGNLANHIVCLNPNGSIDNSFEMGSGFEHMGLYAFPNITSTVEQNDSKILVGGYFLSYNGFDGGTLIRLNPDGTKDESFVIDPYLDIDIKSLEIQVDGKILVAGNSYTIPGIISLNSGGSTNSSFDVGTSYFGLSSLAVNKYGKIYIGGNFTSYKGQDAPYLMALYGDSVVNLPNSNDVNIIEAEFTDKGYATGNSYLEGTAAISLHQTNGLILDEIKIKNENILVSFPQNTQFKKANGITNYSGLFIPPKHVNIEQINNKPVISTIKLGNFNESLTLDGTANIKIPAPSKNIGDIVKVYSSQNGSNRSEEGTATIVEYNGQKYADLSVNHFTYFAIAENVEGSFTINNDATSTTTQSVTLNIDAPGATLMRFSNTSGANWSGWVTYSTSYPWTLSEGYENKTVYAQFDIDSEIFDVSDSILYTDGNGVNGNITLTITGGVTECIYGTSLDMNSQDVKIGIPYTFTGTFPSTWYCQDYRGIDLGWTLTIQTSDLRNENNNVISGSNLLISHDPVVVEGDLSCTGYNGTATEFYSSPYPIFAKSEGSKKICKVSADNISLLVNVPANQAPGNYSGTLTLTMNGF